MKRVFSGIQPSGIIHLGNYLGAIKQWVPLQDEYECIFSIVDLHAITVPQDPKEISKNILRAAATYIACGIDPKKSTIFIQSHRPEHTELAWIISTFTHFGEMRRMTQFKEKSDKFSGDNVPLGIFTYPTLMAADILLYQTDLVPVGEDQKQHVELTRNLAQRFNNKYPARNASHSDAGGGRAFTIPEPRLNNEGARIMALDDPNKKMSKSAASPNNYIALTDDADTIKRKIAKAVTDSGSEIKTGDNKPAITNLLTIYSLLAEIPVSELEEKYKDSSYADFKKDLAKVIVDKITPIGYKVSEIEQDRKALLALLDKGASNIAPLAQNTLGKVRDCIGLV